MGVPRFSTRLRAVTLFAAAMFPAASPLAVPSGASAHVAPQKPPRVKSTRCQAAQGWSCYPREALVLRGHGLERVTSVAFMGGRGGRDDRSTVVERASSRRVVVTVPSGARSGPLRIRTPDSVARTSRALRLRKPPRDHRHERVAKGTTPIRAQQGEVFPIQGKHDMGQSATNDFGGARAHKGQDMFAACGTPLAASASGTIQAKGYHSAAGNYVVVQDAAGRSHVYMHMASPATVQNADRVDAGQIIGTVGQTGRASGCHLHFELWTAPGWYRGGAAIDPLPQLREWESAPHSHRG